MAYFRKVVKDSVFEELKIKNPMITLTIPDGLGERVCCSLKRKNSNNNGYYNVHIDSDVNSIIEIPFLDLYNYNKNILQLGSIVMLQDSVDDKSVEWLIQKLNLQPVYEIISSIYSTIEESYSVESIQYVINCLEANKNALTQQQLFVIRNMLNYNIIQNASADIVQELIPILDSVFSNTSWSSDNRSTKRLFI